MKAISLRDTIILKDWIDGKTQKQLATENKISRTRIRQILMKNRRTLPDNKRI
jgi:DNA-directed RNA polymerase sigma subunit (sigma70/sigma32)